MKRDGEKSRMYPMACTSAYCGRIECPADCRHLPKLEGFREWKKRTDAYCPDPIWTPNYFVAGDAN